jgi:hypothetical protein
MRTYAFALSCAALLVACGDNLKGDQPPTAADRAITTAEDTPVEFTISATDPEGEALRFTASEPDHGTIAVSGSTLTYTPDANYQGPDSATITVSDGELTATATVTITVTPVNDAPVAVDDSAAAAEDTAATITAAALVANDTDVDGDPLTISAVGAAVNGTVALAGTDITFTPAADFVGDATFEYTVSDGTATDTAVVTVAVGGANDPPVAVDDIATTAEDTAATLTAATLLANDTDAEGQTLSLTAVSGATNGTVALAGGTVTFTPAANFAGTAGFDYTVSDGAATDTGRVTVTVTPVNDAPVAVDDTATTTEDTAATLTAATLLANDTDAEGATLTVTAVSGATNGTVALAGTTVTFTPAANFSGTAGFDYTVSDGTATDTGRVTVTVTAVNDPPIAVDDTATTVEDTAATLTAATLLANDTDAEGATLTLTAVSGATNGTVALAGTTVTFTPAANFAGTAGFDYTVSDGTATDTGRVTVTVTAVNDPPVAVDDTATTAEDTAATLTAATLLANDTDAEGATLSITAVSGATNGTVALAGTTVTFTPAANFSGTAGFDYTVSDGTATDTGRVTVTVTAVNDPPVAVDDTATTVEDTAATITAATLLANDTDAEGATLTVTAVSGATNGTVALAGTTITFTPAANFSGTAGFDYVVSDGTTTDTGRVTVTVTAVNDPPVAVDDTATTTEDTAATLTAATLLANDTDGDGDTLTITAVGGATNGTVALAGTTVTFTPAANFAGTAGFDYTVSDGTATDTGRVTVTVTAVNDPPVAVDDTATTAEDTAATLTAATLLANDTDGDGDTLTITAVGGATNGTVALAGTTVTFTPAANFSGTAGFDYTVTDGTATDTGRVTVTVTPVNDAPVAVDDAGTTNQDVAVTFTDATLLANDTDADGDLLAIIAVGGAVNGTVGRAAGVTTFTPTTGFTGFASFTYTVTDGATVDTGLVTVSIGNVNDPPIAVDDTATTAEDTAATITAATLVANDTDFDGDTLTVTAVDNPTNGTVTLAGGVITFTPTANFAGTAGFDYTVSDGVLSDTGRVTVTVTAVDDPPVAVDDTATTDEDSALLIPVATLLANDTDLDSTPTVTAVGGATNGTVGLAAGVVTFTPTANFFGVAGFDYTISDGTSTDIGRVTVTVTAVDDLPVAVADVGFTDEDLGIFVDVLTNDTGLGDGGLTIAIATAPANGTATPGATNILYIPNANHNGTDTFTYTVTDADGDVSPPATVTINLNAVNDPPVANGQTVSVNENGSLVITLTGNDLDGDALTFAVATGPTNGALGAITPATATSATVTYTPTAGYVGPDSFTFTANDGTVASGPAAVTIDVVLVRPSVTATFPPEGARGVRAATPVSITFSTAMNPASLTAQTTSGPCTGTLQLSSDNFASCVGFAAAAPAMTGTNTVATWTPTTALATLGRYQLRVDGAAANAVGTTLNTTFTQATPFEIATDGTCAATVVISQVYGSGGLSGALVNADYIELHNPGTTPASLNGMAVQYASATGTSWSPRALPNVSIPPGGYFLIRTTNPGTNGAAITPDFVTATTMDMSGSNGKLALTATAAALPSVACPLANTLDLYGYGTANCSEGGTAGPALSASNAATRAGAGCTDNNTNNTDFANATPAPRNGATAPLICACTANETDRVAEVDYCNLQFPASFAATAGSTTALIYGRLFDAGTTEAAGSNAQVRAEFGFGAAGVNPATTPGFGWFPAAFNVQVGNDDEYQGSFTAPAPGTYGYTSRFSRDGTNWTYCDLDGAGANAGLVFDPSQLGVMTINP